MGKRSIDVKATRQFITENRAQGKTDQEIYNELSQEYYDKKNIALLITGTPTEEKKQQYGIYNKILLGLLGLSVMFKFLYVMSLITSTGSPALLLLILVLPLINLYFIYEVSRYNASIYRLCGFLTIAGFLRPLGSGSEPTDIAINLVFTVAICGVAFYIDSNMFPDYSPRNLKKDENGEYILS
jgi:hypothetical protein